MNNVYALDIPAPNFDGDAWNDLLNFIEKKRFIPIIGPELLRVETESDPRLFNDWLADKLAAKIGVDTTLLPSAYNLKDDVCWFLSSGRCREDTYTCIRSILREITLPPPRALLE